MGNEQLVEVALQPRYPGERVCGSLVFGATLIMSPRTTERSAKAGGVAALQAEAAAEVAKTAAHEAAIKGRQAAQRKAKARAEAAAAAEAKAAAEEAADAARASALASGTSPDGGGGAVDMAALSGTALGAVESATRRLKQTLHAVECQALPTLPAPGTKGVDRAWVSSLYDVACSIEECTRGICVGL